MKKMPSGTLMPVTRCVDRLGVAGTYAVTCCLTLTSGYTLLKAATWAFVNGMPFTHTRISPEGGFLT